MNGNICNILTCKSEQQCNVNIFIFEADTKYLTFSPLIHSIKIFPIYFPFNNQRSKTVKKGIFLLEILFHIKAKSFPKILYTDL